MSKDILREGPYGNLRRRRLGQGPTARSNQPHKLGDVLPGVIEGLQQPVDKPSSEEQREIHGEGLEGASRDPADLEKRRG